VSIIQEIQSWSQSLPMWQQDAIARLYVNRTLSQEDLTDLTALLKAQYEIPDPQNRQPNKLSADEIAAPSITNRLVQVTAIKNLMHVNALAEGQRVSLSPVGLTVIFGENGAGKSGYSRVLKHACRARDQREPILPDMRRVHSVKPLASAIFEVTIDGQQHDLQWVHGTAAPEQLSEIAIFDSHCARAYVDNAGDFAYAPYGLDILEGLVRACTLIKTKITQELSLNQPNKDQLLHVANSSTKVGRLVSSLSARTNVAEVEALANLSGDEIERLAILNKALSAADPKQKAQVLDLKATRFYELANRIDQATSFVNDAAVLILMNLIDKSKACKIAAELASKQFKEQPGLLLTTGSDVWQLLFEAARAFSEHSHTGYTYPHLDAASPCPLCQNALGNEGLKRLITFDAFIQGEAEKNAKATRTEAITAYRNIEQCIISFAIDEALKAELKDCSPSLATACFEFEISLVNRKRQILEATGDEALRVQITPLPGSPATDLRSLGFTLKGEAKALLASLDEKAKASMIAEKLELDARQKLQEVKNIVLNAIEKYILCAKLKTCTDSIVVTGISRKSTELSKTMATQELADALNIELAALNVDHLKVAMKPESPGGKTQFKLVLELPNSGVASNILSEGEQRAIAIASFLAEVKLGRNLGGVVFDDPVSSLDHARRERVAKRLTIESQTRQVIVLTHDLYFLNVLVHEARRIGTELTTLTARRSVEGFGVIDNALPFEGASTKDRVGQLRQMQVDCTRFQKNGDTVNYRRAVRDTYSHLRMAWERAVEEVLFNGVVLRFRKGIETNKLKKVNVAPEDIATIELNMGKCSTFTGHDGALNANPAMPEPNELSADIEALETWRFSKTKA
jgi:AAA15 family ATPase/GTPase